jgi:hypothetical protein
MTCLGRKEKNKTGDDDERACKRSREQNRNGIFVPPIFPVVSEDVPNEKRWKVTRAPGHMR